MLLLIRVLLLVLSAAALGGLAIEARAETREVSTRDTATVRLRAPGAVLNINFSPDDKPVPRQPILDWISRSARAVALYFGRFPVPEGNILIVTTAGHGVKGGKTFGGPNAFLRVTVGRDSDAADLAKDWVMVHEMIHLAVPLMNDMHDWLTEGLAVYVESVARLQAGDLDEKTVWQGFVEGMAHGVPHVGDRGLDYTHTWGRTYWGGAIFCLVADLEIRKRTHGQKSLQDAMRGMLAKADFRTSLPIRKALAAADAATGTTVLMDLYEAWRAKAVDPHLPKLWQRLGVRPEGRTIAFDDEAVLAATRKRIGHPMKN